MNVNWRIKHDSIKCMVQYAHDRQSLFDIIFMFIWSSTHTIIYQLLQAVHSYRSCTMVYTKKGSHFEHITQCHYGRWHKKGVPWWHETTCNFVIYCIPGYFPSGIFTLFTACLDSEFAKIIKMIRSYHTNVIKLRIQQSENYIFSRDCENNSVRIQPVMQ